jgi:hypothetical protein
MKKLGIDKTNLPKRVLVGLTVDKYEGLMPSIILPGLKALGVEYVEFTKTVFEEVEAVSKKMGPMKAGFHLPLIYDDGWDFSCLEFQPQIYDTIDKINLHKDRLRLQHVIAHPPEPEASEKPLQSDLDFLFQNLAMLHLPVYLENVPYGTPADFVAIFHKAKASLGDQLAGMCFDAPHYFITGFDPVAQFQDMNGNIGCIHLSDCYRNDDVHLPFNKGGELPIDSLLAAMKEDNFRGYITLEIKPDSLKDVPTYVESYMKVLSQVSVSKFWRTKIRWLFIRPLLRYFLS